jgi:Flp pilus assembly protein TadD
MKNTLFLAMLALSLAGCTTEAIKMKNAQTGQITTCGPYPSDMIIGGNTQAQREAGCIKDFQRQGYERMP